MTHAARLLRETREQRGLTQTDVAVAAGVSIRSVSLAENDRPLGNKTLRKIALALDLEPEAILTRVAS